MDVRKRHADPLSGRRILELGEPVGHAHGVESTQDVDRTVVSDEVADSRFRSCEDPRAALPE